MACYCPNTVLGFSNPIQAAKQKEKDFPEETEEMVKSKAHSYLCSHQMSTQTSPEPLVTTARLGRAHLGWGLPFPWAPGAVFIDKVFLVSTVGADIRLPHLHA